MTNVSANYHGTKLKISGKVFQAKRAENAKMKGEKIQYSLKVELEGEGAGRQLIMKNIQLTLSFALL